MLFRSFFEAHDSLQNLQAFVSDNAMKIYGLQSHFATLPPKIITLEKATNTIPNVVHIKSLDAHDKKEAKEYDFAKSYDKFATDCVIPFRAGEQIGWKLC